MKCIDFCCAHQGRNISHLWIRKITFKSAFGSEDVSFRECRSTCLIQTYISSSQIETDFVSLLVLQECHLVGLETVLVTVVGKNQSPQMLSKPCVH